MRKISVQHTTEMKVPTPPPSTWFSQPNFMAFNLNYETLREEVHNYGFQSIETCTAIAEVEKYRLENIQLNYWMCIIGLQDTAPMLHSHYIHSESDGKISQSNSSHLQIHGLINTARSSARLI